MNKSLSTFMVIAFTALLISTLIFGVVFPSLEETNTKHQENMQYKHQLKFK